MGHVKYGPRPPPTWPPLSPRALRLLHASLTHHELNFLFGDFLKLYPRLPRGEAKTQGVSFEMLCLAAGLKETVLIGWGDGTDEQGDGMVATTWLQQVWEQTRADVASRTLDDETRDADYVALQNWIEIVQLHKLGNVQGETAVFNGHFLLYLFPPSPVLAHVLSVDSDQKTRGNDPSNPTILDETTWAYVLDYPTKMPPNRYFYDDTLRREKVVQVNLNQNFIDGSLCGTEYFSSNTASDLQRAQWHFQRYSKRLDGVVDVSLQFNGIAQGEPSGAQANLRSLKPILSTGIDAIEQASASM